MSKETEKDTELEKEENTSAESEEVKEAADTAENATEDTEKKAEESETEKLKKELAEANDKYLRLMAEYDNFRSRAGFIKFCPRPPKSCFTTIIAKILPSTGIQSGIPAGIFRPIRSPVTTALKSFTVFFLCIK